MASVFRETLQLRSRVRSPPPAKNYCSHNIAELLPIRVVGSSPTIKSQSDYPWGLVQLRDRCFGCKLGFNSLKPSLTRRFHVFLLLTTCPRLGDNANCSKASSVGYSTV